MSEERRPGTAHLQGTCAPAHRPGSMFGELADGGCPVRGG